MDGHAILVNVRGEITLRYLIRFFLLTACITLVSALTTVLASEASTVKVGVLDWQQLFSKAPQAEEAGKRLEKEFQGAKDRLINKQKEFQTKRDKLQRDKDVMSAHERAKKEKELAKMEQDLRRMDEELRSDYTTRHREETDDFVKTVREIVENFAADQKYDLVLPQEATIYVSDRVDITDTILTKLEDVKAKSPKEAEKKGETKSSDKKS